MMDAFEVVSNLDEIPEPKDMNPGVLYVWNRTDLVIHLCPCGCGIQAVTPTKGPVQPYWELTRHDDGTISLAPSILNTGGCRSHYFIRRNQVVWA